MKRVICTCDKCGEEIKDIYYSLTCFAVCLPGEDPVKHFDAAVKNVAESKRIETDERHLCRTCKDAITDGIFIL